MLRYLSLFTACSLAATRVVTTDDSDFERPAAEVGAVELLRKPFTGDELLRAVDLAIKSQR